MFVDLITFAVRGASQRAKGTSIAQFFKTRNERRKRKTCILVRAYLLDIPYKLLS